MNPSIASRLTRTLLSTTFAGLLLLAPSTAFAICGDGMLDGQEECDDGNTNDGDCCSEICQFESGEGPCTDGNECTVDFCDGQGTCLSFPNQQAECDDGNACTVGDFCNSDGFCTSDGTLEDGSTCFDDNLCGSTGQCFFGFCFGDPVGCEGYGACNSAVCNPDTAKCEVTQLEDGTPCDNPSACTDPGTCTNGECQQPPTDCSHLADDCNDAFCDVEAGGCYTVWKENGTACDDTNGCTDPGTCDDGECSTTPKDCSSFADQCNDAACDPKTEDGCFAAPKENDTPCNDGDICSEDDVCTDGTCDGTPIDCSASGDDCNFAFCNPQTGECVTTPVETPTICDDGDPCTENDRCLAGLCIGQPKDCSVGDTACTTGVCNPESGECEAQPNEDGGECTDGDLCTLGDACVGGECTGTPLDCSGSSDQCNVGFCNGDTGGCESDPIEEPTSCDDDDPCTTGDACSNGECAGTPKDCSDFDSACAVGVCGTRTGECVAQDFEDGTGCNDGNLCTTGDQCTDGQCGGTPKDCSASGGNCQVGECNPDTGQCVGEPAEDGTSCSDGNLCTQSDECSSGECIGDPVTCGPATAPCQESFCNPQVGQCQNRDVEDGTTCSDGNLCTTTDVCTDGACGGTTTDCSDLDDDCNVGSCNTATGGCVAQPRENGTTCSDGALCTTGDQCTAGVCGGTPVDCSSLDNACNVGSCNTATGGCVAQPRENGTTCSDGVPCTSGDQCTAGVCAGAPVDCSNLDAPCKTGRCNTQSGLCEAIDAADETPCSDGAFCTATDACTGGVCVGSGDPCEGTATCDGQCNEAGDTCNATAGTPCESDGNPCTDDVCDGEGNCAGEANDGSCDDGLFCTTGDHCADTVCIGEATCPQTSACGDTCDEANDACRTCGHPFSNSRCIVNAIFVLQGALGLRECELCTCDVDSSGDVMATDALQILRTCTALPVVLECPSGAQTTTTTTSTTTTTESGCEAALHNAVFNEKYTCVQTFTGGEPFCADQNEQDAIRFTHLGDGLYEVRDEPDTGFVMTGSFVDCLTFPWNASSPGEYSEGGVWTFSNDATTFSGSSAYVAEDLTYAGACNETGARSPAVPPDPTPIEPCP